MSGLIALGFAKTGDELRAERVVPGGSPALLRELLGVAEEDPVLDSYPVGAREAALLQERTGLTLDAALDWFLQLSDD